MLFVQCSLLAANGAVQDSRKRNQDKSVLKRRARSGPEGGPGPEGKGGGRDVANGELLMKSLGLEGFSFLL